MDTRPVETVVVVVDLSRYSDICKQLEQQLGVEAVAALNQQIQLLIRTALAAAKVEFTRLPFKSTGDGAIIAIDGAEQATHFAGALHNVAEEHNRHRDVPLAQRHFRVGVWSGSIMLQPQRTESGDFIGFDFAGTSIANAVRLESACRTGEVLISADTWAQLPQAMRSLYGKKETVRGKREEQFQAHRRVVVPPAPWDADRKAAGGSTAAAPGSQAAPTARSHLEQLLNIHSRRLQVLEKQAATLGVYAPPHVTMEIDDTKRIIVELGGQVGESGGWVDAP